MSTFTAWGESSHRGNRRPKYAMALTSSFEEKGEEEVTPGECFVPFVTRRMCVKRRIRRNPRETTPIKTARIKQFWKYPTSAECLFFPPSPKRGRLFFHSPARPIQVEEA